MIADKLARLGVRRLLLAIHDVSFPCDPDEDLGRGSSATRAAERLMAYAAKLGFTGIQLGPQGQTSRGNPSPYDGTIFARHTGNIAADTWRALVGNIDAWLVDGGPARHAHNYDATEALLKRAWSPTHAVELAAFRAANSWLDPAADDIYAYGQLLAHREHARVRAAAKRHGLDLYGDLQVGYSVDDARRYADAFLTSLHMGAPPSRTNPDGQAWGYPVLDPEKYAGAAGALVQARADKTFAEYDGVRVDHPHGFVCPWVYAGDVKVGTRLFESPDRLSRYAIARIDQLDDSQPRYADGWVTELDEEQIDRYARLFQRFVDSARRHGRDPRDLSCEVLSTMPLPLAKVLQRYGLGRWRVLQKAVLDNPADVYRCENAEPADWVMLGNHDTAPIFAVLREQPDKWRKHLRKLLPDAPLADAHDLATAMLAELFASRAENAMIFFADLFGLEERFNVPGVVSSNNWSLRLPPDFEQLRGLDLDRACDLALQIQARQRR